MAATDALVEEWSRQHDRAEIIALARAKRLPVAPVRDLVEVTNDPHMHERGMLERIDHPVFGRIVVPTSPLRFHGADKVETVPSPEAGQHNGEVLDEWLGLSEDEVEQLRNDGVI